MKNTYLPVVSHLTEPVEVILRLHPFLAQLVEHVAGVDVQHDESLERGAVLLGELASHHEDNLINLLIVDLQVFGHSVWPPSDGLVHVGCPE